MLLVSLFLALVCLVLLAIPVIRNAANRYFLLAWYYLVKAKNNPWLAMRMVRTEQRGALTVQTILMIFIVMVVVYQLIPEISNSNQTVQGSANVSTMGKFAAGLGEWMFPLGAMVAGVFILFTWSRSRGKKGGS